MKMKLPAIKLFAAILGVTLLTNSLFAAEKKQLQVAKPAKALVTNNNNSCAKEKADFKYLYIELQKSLNYEGKDAYLDGKGNLQLKDHSGGEYEGKVFEEALFKEYQNTLRKVGLMYQAAKFDAANNKDFSSNKALVDFIKAIDSNDGSKYIETNNVNTVIDGLQQASQAKYPGDSKFRINDNDKYLLKKLLTHAQDRLCSIEKYAATGKKTIYFSAEELEKKKNAPLNQLVLAIRDAKLTKDTDIKLDTIVDDKVAINSAIAANVNALTEWMKKNKACADLIKSQGFMNTIQAGVQPCNYGKFVDSISDENVKNIEQILHFINANEKFLNGVQTKAETALDEFKLQAYVDRAFQNLGNKIYCTEVQNSTKEGKKLFVRNLPYLDDKNTFDTSRIVCKVRAKKGGPADKVLTKEECSQKIELVSDELGRGLEVKQKNTKEPTIAFSVKDNENCQDIDLLAPQIEKTPEMCKAEGLALNPPKDLMVSPDKKSCIPALFLGVFKTEKDCKAEGEKETPKKEKVPSQDGKACIDKPNNGLKTAEMCKLEGESENPKTIKIPSEDKKTCILDPNAGLKTAESCKEEGEKETPKKEKVPSQDGKTCIDKPNDGLKTAEMCKLEGESENPKTIKIPSEDKKTCILDPNAGLKTAEMCKEEGEKETPKTVKIPSEDKKTCILDPNAGLLTDAICKAKGEAKDPKEVQTLSEDKKSCIVVKEDDGEKKCEAANQKWIDDENEGEPGIKWEWDGKSCVDKKPSKDSGPREKDEIEKTEKAMPARAVPGRFTPINIPTRQMYVLPGMM